MRYTIFTSKTFFAGPHDDIKVHVSANIEDSVGIDTALVIELLETKKHTRHAHVPSRHEYLPTKNKGDTRQRRPCLRGKSESFR